MTDRLALLEQHGRAYGELHLAITFTESNVGDTQAKRVRRKGWPATRPLADPDNGAATLRVSGPTKNPAVVLGASGLLGIDIDGPAGVKLLRELQPGPLPRTITVETAHGYHLWYRRPDGVTGIAKIELGPEGLEVAKEGYLVCPPAVHPGKPELGIAPGHVYRFVDGLAPWDLEPVVLPMRHLEPFLAREKQARAEQITSTGPITAGGRHRHLRRIAGAMRRVGATETSITAALLAENETRCSPPKPDRIVRELARDITSRYQPEVNP